MAENEPCYVGRDGLYNILNIKLKSAVFAQALSTWEMILYVINSQGHFFFWYV